MSRNSSSPSTGQESTGTTTVEIEIPDELEEQVHERVIKAEASRLADERGVPVERVEPIVRRRFDEDRDG